MAKLEYKKGDRSEWEWMFIGNQTVENHIEGLKMRSLASVRRCVNQLSQTEEGRYILGTILIQLLWPDEE